MRSLTKQEDSLLNTVSCNSFQSVTAVISAASRRTILSTAMILILVTSFAHIKNGYEIEATFALKKLDSINKSLEKNEITGFMTYELKSNARKLRHLLKYYQATGYLLELFKSISPSLYALIDTIKDASGKSVDVYVKFYPWTLTKHGVVGTTTCSVTKEEDTPSSSYGISTVSVSIFSLNDWSIIFLAHEFGHIAYQIPNLKMYNNLYFTLYKSKNSTDLEIGHHPDDESGQSAYAFQRSFRTVYTAYMDDRPKKVLTIASR